jgi:tetratricopeptide (TPR) repeat protein
MIRRIRSLILSILMLWKDLSQKQAAARAGMSGNLLSYHLLHGNLEDGTYEHLLAAMGGRPAEVALVTGCVEGLNALAQEGDLTPEERDEIEMGVLELSRLARALFTDAARRSRTLPPLDDYPSPAAVEPLRWLAREQWALLKGFNHGQRLAVVRLGREFQHWALVERLCEESVAEASRDVETAAALARLAREVADLMQGPEWWCRRSQGLAEAHVANALRVPGHLKAARTSFEEAKQLWEAGADPGSAFDPGRLLDLEASLCRAERRFEKALALLDEAIKVGRSPERYYINKGFVLETTGEYTGAVQALLQAQPLVERQNDPRLLYMLRFNLAVNHTHLGFFHEATRLAEQVRSSVLERDDKNELPRLTWLDGRIAAGVGHLEEARHLLDQARRQFAARAMWYDVSLALLELAVLLLDGGQTAQVKVLAQDLKTVFESEGVHREALAALSLFKEATDREAATAELGRRVLSFLFRARNNQGLRFES